MKKAPVTAALFAAVLMSAATVAAKDYYFPEVRVEVAVGRDGAFTVDEFRTFEFDGRFSYAYIVIPVRIERSGVPRNVTITELTVTDERGRSLRTELDESGGRLTAKWYYSAENERRTFHIHYRVVGGITSYPDASELYWQVIGDGWDRPAQNVQATVTLPDPLADGNSLLVWGHGPLAGWAEVVDARTARFSTPDLAAGQYFEIRVVWPAGLVAGVPSDRLTLAAIRAEEEGFVRDTIGRVRQAQADRAARQERDEAEPTEAHADPGPLGPLADRRAAPLAGHVLQGLVGRRQGLPVRRTAGLRPRASVRPAAGLRPIPDARRPGRDPGGLHGDALRSRPPRRPRDRGPERLQEAAFRHQGESSRRRSRSERTPGRIPACGPSNARSWASSTRSGPAG